MIRPYLRDLINYRKPTTELNNNTNNNANKMPIIMQIIMQIIVILSVENGKFSK